MNDIQESDQREQWLLYATGRQPTPPVARGGMRSFFVSMLIAGVLLLVLAAYAEPEPGLQDNVGTDAHTAPGAHAGSR